MFQPPVEWNLLHLQTTAVAWIDHAIRNSDHYADRSEDGYLYSFRLNFYMAEFFDLAFSTSQYVKKKPAIHASKFNPIKKPMMK